MKTQDFTHRYIPATDPQAPTLLMLHGTGGNESSLLNLGAQIAPGAALLSPRGKVLEGGRYPRFFKRFAEGVIDQEDLLLRTNELADWIEAAVSEYGIDTESLVAVGYSNGANIAANIMLYRPNVLRRAVLLRAMLLAPLPEQAPDLRGASALIAAGVADQMLPLADAERLADALQNYGAQVTFAQQPSDHGLISADLVVSAEWIQTTQSLIQSSR